MYPAKPNKRPPTPVKPFANSAHFISPIFLTATTNKFIANAKLIMFELPLKLLPSNVLDTIVIIVIRAPIPKVPFSKAFGSIPLKVFVALANINKAIPKINIPFVWIPNANLLATPNTVNIAPIPYIAFFKLAVSTLERPTKAALNIPIAIANFINADALRLLCHAFNVSPSSSSVPVIDSPSPLNTLKLSPIPSIEPDNVLRKLDIFFINTPLKKVFKTSKKSMLDILSDKALPNFTIVSFKCTNKSINLLPIVTVLSPFWPLLLKSNKPFIVSFISFTVLTILSLTLLKSILFIRLVNASIDFLHKLITVSTKLKSERKPLKDVIKSPKIAPISKTAVTKDLNNKIILGSSLSGWVSTVPTTFNTLNTPSKAFLMFSKALSDNFNFSVNSENFLVISNNLVPDIGGNTLFQASPIDFKTDPRFLTILVSPFINSVLPPKFFHSANILFLLSADCCITSPKAFEILVNKVLASSKSPIIYSHVWVQPDCTASLVVSINWENVFTSVAAALAICPSSTIRWASASV